MYRKFGARLRKFVIFIKFGKVYLFVEFQMNIEKTQKFWSGSLQNDAPHIVSSRRNYGLLYYLVGRVIYKDGFPMEIKTKIRYLIVCGYHIFTLKNYDNRYKMLFCCLIFNIWFCCSDQFWRLPLQNSMGFFDFIWNSRNKCTLKILWTIWFLKTKLRLRIYLKFETFCVCTDF